MLPAEGSLACWVGWLADKFPYRPKRVYIGICETLFAAAVRQGTFISVRGVPHDVLSWSDSATKRASKLVTIHPICPNQASNWSMKQTMQCGNRKLRATGKAEL